MMKILITGGTGQLGRALVQASTDRHVVTAPGSRDLDVARVGDVVRALDATRPDLVIHAGAMTDVDGCEREAELAYRINALGTQNIAAATNAAGIPLVYLSTNFVFDGALERPYFEFDTPNPINVYGASKLAGERAVAALNSRHFIVRTAMVYDETGRNFVNTMLRLAESHARLTVVADQRGNPTYASDLAIALLRLVEQASYGTYHLTNQESASWHEWACAIFQLAGIDVQVDPIPASEFPRDATPPANGELANLAASGQGIALPNWRDALERCLRRRASIPRQRISS